MAYGKELILDFHDCNVGSFNRRAIEDFLQELCDCIKMTRCDLHFWDDMYTPEGEEQTEPHLKGTTAIQFMLTSNVTIHTLDLLGSVYINIFSCKDFDEYVAASVVARHFGGKVAQNLLIERK